MAIIQFTNSNGVPTMSCCVQDTVRGILREMTINNTTATVGGSNIFQIVMSLGNFPSQIRRHISTHVYGDLRVSFCYETWFLETFS